MTASRVVLHVGLQKSGTTYLQHALANARPALAAAGVHYPVAPTRLADVPNHQHVVYGLLATEFPALRATTRRIGSAEWAWLQAQLPDLSGTVVLSAEILSVVRSAAARRLVEAVTPGDVDVIVTSRALDKLITSTWQQTVKAGRGTTLAGRLRSVAADRAEALALDERNDEVIGRAWRSYSTARLVERWADHVGIDRVTVVTSGGSPPEALWTRFLAAMGYPGLEAVTGPPPPMSAAEQNVGLRRSEAELLCQVNPRLAGLRRKETEGLRMALVDAFRARSAPKEAVDLPTAWRDRVVAWAEEEVATLRQLGVRVVGDLDELRCSPAAPTAATTPEQMLATASTAVLAAAEWALAAQAATDDDSTDSGRATGARDIARKARRRLEGALPARRREAPGAGPESESG